MGKLSFAFLLVGYTLPRTTAAGRPARLRSADASLACACLGQLADSFPGFRYATVLGEEGWGGAVRRDDTEISGRRRNEYFSRLQLVVRPYSQYRVLDLSAKGTVRNKEVLTRTNFQKLDDADLDIFLELVELWVLEYAELYASTNN